MVKKSIRKKHTAAKTENTFTIVIADDDADDMYIVEKAFLDMDFPANLRFVENGEKLLDYLKKSAAYCDQSSFQDPVFILLDLNMPVKDGWTTLEEMKKIKALQNIPVVVWTTSCEEREKTLCLEMGADAFITKPDSYGNLRKNLQQLLERYCTSSYKS